MLELGVRKVELGGKRKVWGRGRRAGKLRCGGVGSARGEGGGE